MCTCVREEELLPPLTPEERQQMAEAFLIKTFNDPVLKGSFSAELVYRAGRAAGLKKSEIREARKRLEIKSVRTESGWKWFWPKGE